MDKRKVSWWRKLWKGNIHVCNFKGIFLEYYEIKGTKKYFKPKFSDITSFHYYTTRYSSSNNLYIKNSCLEIQKRTFSRVGVKICNEIPASLREPPPPLKTKHVKTKLHSFVDDIIKTHDDYIEISQITSTLKWYK